MFETINRSCEHHATVLNYFGFGTQASDLLDMSQFHKISIAKCSYRKRTEKY